MRLRNSFSAQGYRAREILANYIVANLADTPIPLIMIAGESRQTFSQLHDLDIVDNRPA